MARSGDALAIGQVLVEGLTDAPSAEYGPDEVPPRALDIGKELLAEVDPGSHRLLLLAEVRSSVAGLARIGPRDFARSQHIADVLLVVHPAARRMGVGAALLRGTAAAARETGQLAKLVMRVADDDAALVALLRAAGWKRERVETGALVRDDGVRDVVVYAAWDGDVIGDPGDLTLGS